MLLEIGEDGVFVIRMEDGSVLRGRIRSVATADDVITASNLGQSFVAAKVFLQEAVDEARRRGVKLINIEDIAESLVNLMVGILASRRADLLIRAFDALLPPEVVRDYSYYEYASIFTGKPEDATFHVRIRIPGRAAAKVFEDLSELLNELASKMSRLKDVNVEFKVSKDGRDRVIEYGFSTKILRSK